MGKPENKAQLVDLLTYHVASADAHAKDLMDMQMLTTVEGKNVTVRVAGNGTAIFINSAKVTTADVGACNGIVHIIDRYSCQAMPQNQRVSPLWISLLPIQISPRSSRHSKLPILSTRCRVQDLSQSSLRRTKPSPHFPKVSSPIFSNQKTKRS